MCVHELVDTPFMFVCTCASVYFVCLVPVIGIHSGHNPLKLRTTVVTFHAVPGQRCAQRFGVSHIKTLFRSARLGSADHSQKGAFSSVLFKRCFLLWPQLESDAGGAIWGVARLIQQILLGSFLLRIWEGP